jgi:hypothetical protein
MTLAPQLETPRRPYDPDAVLEIRGLKKHFVQSSVLPWKQKSVVRAVDGIDLVVKRGQTLGLVGESGCGKTTTGRMIVRLEQPTSGQILVDGADVAKYETSQIKEYRQKVQMIFQDPYSSLDPKMKIGDIIAEPLTVQRVGSRKERTERVVDLMTKVGLDPQFAAFRGTASANRYRPLPRSQSQRHHRRRTHFRSRRVRACPGHQPAARSPERNGTQLRLHLARPRYRSLHLGFHRSDVSRKSCRGGTRARTLRQTSASVHEGSARRGARTRPGARRAARGDSPQW